jgi:hypothetical protein
VPARWRVGGAVCEDARTHALAFRTAPSLRRRAPMSDRSGLCQRQGGAAFDHVCVARLCRHCPSDATSSHSSRKRRLYECEEVGVTWLQGPREAGRMQQKRTPARPKARSARFPMCALYESAKRVKACVPATGAQTLPSSAECAPWCPLRPQAVFAPQEDARRREASA